MEGDFSRDSFAIKVRGLSMNRVYPTGTTVICVPLSIYGDEIEPGDRVVCHLRHRTDDNRVAIREIEVDGEGRAWLSTRTDQPPLEEAVAIAWPISEGGAAVTELGAVTIIAVVVASYRAEPAGVRSTEEARIRWRELLEHREEATPEELHKWIVET